MQSITQAEIQELVLQLPEAKLPRAYQLLQELVADQVAVSEQAAFLRLPPEERARLLREQAQDMKEYYEQTAQERQNWQSGDFQDEH
jgi:hypothetical protein